MISSFRKVFFNLWYLFSPPWDSGVSPPELIQFIEENPTGAALDIGCGTATNVITLAQNGWIATGVDYAANAIRAGRRKAKQAGVSLDLRVGDATRLDGIHGPFDLILDMGCFHAIDLAGQERYLDRIDALLADQGTFMLYMFYRDEKDTGPGATAETDRLIETRLKLIHREYGENLGVRPSAWSWYKK